MSTDNKKKKNRANQYFGPVAGVVVAVLVMILVVMATQIMTPAQPVDEQGENTTNEQDSSTAAISESLAADYAMLQHVNSSDVLRFFAQQETGFLYVGRISCPHCRAFTPLLAEAVRDTGAIVNYYDTDTANSDPDKKSQAFALLGVEGVPTLLFIRNGVIVATLGNTQSEMAIREFLSVYR